MASIVRLIVWLGFAVCMIDVSLKRRTYGKDKQERVETNHDFDQVISSTFKYYCPCFLQESFKKETFKVFIPEFYWIILPNHPKPLMPNPSSQSAAHLSDTGGLLGAPALPAGSFWSKRLAWQERRFNGSISFLLFGLHEDWGEEYFVSFYSWPLIHGVPKLLTPRMART